MKKLFTCLVAALFMSATILPVPAAYAKTQTAGKKNTKPKKASGGKKAPRKTVSKKKSSAPAKALKKSAPVPEIHDEGGLPLLLKALGDYKTIVGKYVELTPHGIGDSSCTATGIVDAASVLWVVAPPCGSPKYYRSPMEGPPQPMTAGEMASAIRTLTPVTALRPEAPTTLAAAVPATAP